MNERKKLEERERSIVEELRSRRSTSQRQAEHAIDGDNRVAPDEEHEEEREDDGAFGDDRRELSVSEKQAACATRGASRRAS